MRTGACQSCTVADFGISSGDEFWHVRLDGIPAETFRSLTHMRNPAVVKVFVNHATRQMVSRSSSILLSTCILTDSKSRLSTDNKHVVRPNMASKTVQPCHRRDRGSPGHHVSPRMTLPLLWMSVGSYQQSFSILAICNDTGPIGGLPNETHVASSNLSVDGTTTMLERG